MSYRYRLFLALSFGLLSLLTSFALAADFTTARIAVYFSPSGGATDAVVREVNTASQQILVQAYSFTSVPIAKALVDAHKRGVKILAVLDKSNQAEKYSAATFLANAGIQTLIDDRHVIAHNKVMVIDSATILTGSFNFTQQAEKRNAENLLVVVFQKWRWSLSYCPSKSIAVDKQADDKVVHLYRFREADGLADQAFDPRP